MNKIWAIIRDRTVINIIIANEQSTVNNLLKYYYCVQIDGANEYMPDIGDSYDPASNKFVKITQELVREVTILHNEVLEVVETPIES
jgi:hypothetical protein